MRRTPSLRRPGGAWFVAFPSLVWLLTYSEVRVGDPIRV